MSENDAVASLGEVSEIVKNCRFEMLSSKKQKNPIRAAGILLAALSPIIAPLAIAFAVLYLVLIIVWGSFIFTFGATSASGILVVIAGLLSLGEPILGIAAIGFGLMLFGISFLLTYGTFKLGKISIINLTAKLAAKFIKK